MFLQFSKGCIFFANYWGGAAAYPAPPLPTALTFKTLPPPCPGAEVSANAEHRSKTKLGLIQNSSENLGKKIARAGRYIKHQERKNK